MALNTEQGSTRLLLLYKITMKVKYKCFLHILSHCADTLEKVGPATIIYSF
jgi:hypothetical protein